MTSSTHSSNNPILAIACGPIVTTWDISKHNNSISTSTSLNYNTTSTNDNNNTSSASSSSPSIINATEILSPSTSLTSRNGITSSSVKLSSMGIEQFQPFHDYGLDGCTIRDIVWNHNGQVLATCSNIIKSGLNKTSSINNDIALTLYSSQTTLECFSNTNINCNSNNTYDYHQTTSISFGGSNAKSRYICVSDNGGNVSVWDMKKRPVKRVRCFTLQPRNEDGSVDTVSAKKISSKSSTSSNMNGVSIGVGVGCSKACMDRSDTFVIGLHGDTRPAASYHNTNISSSSVRSSFVTLDLFHLKNGNLVTSLQDDGTHGGSSNCFHFSHLDPNQLLVGTKNGSLLLWDISSTTSTTPNTATVTNSSPATYSYSPITTLDTRHSNHVTDVAFSPMNKVLAASCSLDGYVMFHDVQSKKIIQTLKPPPPTTYSTNTMARGRDVSDVGIHNGGLTSLAFDPNGYTWAVGTNYGHVLNYDLRQISAGPLSTLNVGDVVAHDDQYQYQNQQQCYPVNRLQFAPMPSSSSSSSVKGLKSSVKKNKGTSSTASISKSTTSISKSTATMSKDDLANQEDRGSSMMKDENRDSSASRIDYVVTGKDFDSPKQSSSMTVTKELFQSKHNAHESVPDDYVPTNLNLHDTTEKENNISMLKSPTVNESNVNSATNNDACPTSLNMNSYRQSNLSMLKSPMVQESATVQKSIEKDNYEIASQNKPGHINESTTDYDITDSVISSFDKMYERLKNREIYSPTAEQQSALLSSTLIDNVAESAANTISLPDEKPSIPSTIKRTLNSNENVDVFMLTRKQIEDIVDDAVESLRDDMDEALQSLQCDFMRQLQRQSDETRELLKQQKRDMEVLLKENEFLRQGNSNSRLF